MKILIFSTAYVPWIGGAEVAVKEITDRLPDMQFDLLTVNLNGKEKAQEKIGNVNIFRVGSGTFGKFLFPFFGLLKAKQLQQKNKYDATWSIMASQASIAAAFFRKKFPRVPLVLTLQEGDEEEHLKRYALGSTFLYRIFIRPWHTLVFRRADRVTAISNYLRERALKNGVTVPIDIVPNGVDVQRFVTDQTKPETTEKTIITTSRLVKKNAIEDLITSLSFLPDTVRLQILGVGPDESKLKARVQKSGLIDRVHFLGHVDQEKIPSYLHTAHVFARPSLSEGMGNSFIEAMAAGVPVVATPVGGIVDFLQDGETGVFCRVNDPKSIADAVLKILNDTNLREKITTNAKKMVSERYDWAAIAPRMKNVFDSVVSKP